MDHHGTALVCESYANEGDLRRDLLYVKVETVTCQRVSIRRDAMVNS